MNSKLIFWIATALAGVTGAANAQTPDRTGMPSAQAIAQADRYDPPKLAALAAKLASQPDMTGSWQHVQPQGTCRGPLFDPAHSVCPSQPLAGEATFGPSPGTYVTGIPYKPGYRKLYEQHVKEAQEGHARDTFAACIPYGAPRMVGESPAPFDIVQAPEVMIWYNPYARTERRIFLDGRKHDDETNSFNSGPSYSGRSTGHWEGDTLVVYTVNMIAAFFDETASPHSDKLSMVERIRLVQPDVIENKITIDDPVALERPWVVTRYYRRVPTRAATKSTTDKGPPPSIHNYVNLNDRPCIPNVKIDENGFQVLLLPQEIEAEEAKGQGKSVPPAR